MDDAKLMLDAGPAAFRAAKTKDVAALDALNDQLYTSCTSCHQHYRPDYGRRPRPARRADRPHRPVSRRTCPDRPTSRRRAVSRGPLEAARPPRICAPTARVARLSVGRASGRLDCRRARRLLRADHVERHAVVPGRRDAAGRADEGGAAQHLHRLLGTLHDQRGRKQRDAEGRCRVAARPMSAPSRSASSTSRTARCSSARRRDPIRAGDGDADAPADARPGAVATRRSTANRRDRRETTLCEFRVFCVSAISRGYFSIRRSRAAQDAGHRVVRLVAGVLVDPIVGLRHRQHRRPRPANDAGSSTVNS